MEAILNTLHQHFAIINLNVELVLDSIMHHHTGFDIDLIVFIVPVRLESNWNSIPPVWVNMTQSITAHFNDTLCKNMRLLLQMMMVLVWVVECPVSHWCKASQLDLFLHGQETLLHHFSLLII